MIKKKKGGEKRGEERLQKKGVAEREQVGRIS